MKNARFLKYLFIFVSILTSFAQAFAQDYYVVRGYVYSDDNEPLINASVRVVNTQSGTTTDAEGRYAVQVPQGLNRIVFTYIGYKTQQIEVVVTEDLVKNIYMETDENLLGEVEVRVRRKDYSYEVIQNVIDNREKFRNQYQSYTAQMYIKAVENVDRPQPKPNKTEEEKLTESVLASDEPVATNDSIPNLNLFECTLTRYVEVPDKQKEERTAVKKLNDQSTLFFTSITDGEFDLYNNLQYVPKLSDNQFVSPIGNLAFVSYKFKLLGSYYEDNQKIYHIKVIPMKLGNALYEGELEVYDNLWVLKSAKLSLNKRALRQYNSFDFEQNYAYVDKKWLPTLVKYNWYIKEGNTKKTGYTTVRQSDYVFNETFPKKFFGAELGVTTAEAYQRDTTFWASIRPEPLTKEELKFVQYKDSVSAVMNSKAYLDSVDAVYNRITPLKVLWSGVGHINRSEKREWFFNPLVTVFNPFAVGGWRVGVGVTHYKRFENRKYYSMWFNPTYGFLNKDFRGNFSGTYLYNPLRISSIGGYARHNVEFVNGSATINDFLRRNNFYLSTQGGIVYRTELINGLYLNATTHYELRQDLSNMKFQINNEEITGGVEPVVFPDNRVFKTVFQIDYTPKQLYLREPNQKVVLGSHFPTFTLKLDKAWGGQNPTYSKFTYLELSARHLFNVGIIGQSEYRISGGKFLDTTRLAIMDYKYQRGGDKFFFSPAMYTFQLIDQTFPTFNWYFEGHYVHQFNGFLTSKVPLLNKTGIKTMAGGGLLYVPERNYQYSELYFGANRVFKFGRQLIRFGVYNVLSQNNQTGLRNMIKFSFEPFNPEKNTWSF